MPSESVENVEDSDSDLTDLDDLEDDDDNNVVVATENSMSLRDETESGGTRIVNERSI